MSEGMPPHVENEEEPYPGDIPPVGEALELEVGEMHDLDLPLGEEETA